MALSASVKSKILWGIFLAFLLTIFFAFLNINLEWNIRRDEIRFMIRYVFPATLVLLHCFWTLSYARGSFFLLLSLFVGFVAEILGMKTGIIFGSAYVYNIGAAKLLGVPILIVFFWMIFIYVCYCVTTSFLCWLDKEKPSIKKKNFAVIPLLVLMDGFFVMSIDLFAEPLFVIIGNWTWAETGPYYGIPTGNFIGWFGVAAIACGIFRIYEYHFPRGKMHLPESIMMLPVWGYGAIAILLGYFAMILSLYGLFQFGMCLMMIPVVMNTYFFLTQKK